MGSLTSVTGLFGMGMSAYQSYQQAEAEKKKAAMAADELEVQAGLSELAADEAKKQGELAMAENKAKGRLERAAKKVDYAASGVKVNEGTPVGVLADMAAWNEYERQKIEYQANLKSWGLEYEAADLRRKAANARATGVSPVMAATRSLGQSFLSEGLSLLKKE